MNERLEQLGEKMEDFWDVSTEYDIDLVTDYVTELEFEVQRLEAGLQAAKKETAEVRKEVDYYTVARVEELEKSKVREVYIAYDDGTLVGVFSTVEGAQGACTSFSVQKSRKLGLSKEVTSLTPWQQEVYSYEYPVERFITCGRHKWEQWIDKHTVEGVD